MYYALNNCKLKTSVPAPCSLPPGAGDVSSLHGEEEPLLLDGEDPHLLVRGKVGGRSLMNNEHGPSLKLDQDSKITRPKHVNNPLNGLYLLPLKGLGLGLV